MTAKKCTACHRKAGPDSRYCSHHQKALEIITNQYRVWVDAYGRISWGDFLNRLPKMQESGSWVKEVIEAESKK